MAKGGYIGVSGVARKIKKGYVGVDNISRKIKKAYMGVGGVAKLIWSGTYNNDFFVLYQYDYQGTDEEGEYSGPTYATLLKFNMQMELIASAPSIRINNLYSVNSDGIPAIGTIDNQGNVYIGVTLPRASTYKFYVYKYSNDLSQQLGSYHTSFTSNPDNEGFRGMCYDSETNYIYISVSRSPYIAIIDCNTMSEINSFTSPRLISNIQTTSTLLTGDPDDSYNPMQYNKNTLSLEYTFSTVSGTTGTNFLYAFNDNQILGLTIESGRPSNYNIRILDKTEGNIATFTMPEDADYIGRDYLCSVNLNQGVIYFINYSVLYILDFNLQLIKKISLSRTISIPGVGTLSSLQNFSFSDMDGNYIYNFYNHTNRTSELDMYNIEGELVSTTIIPSMPDESTLITDPNLYWDKYSSEAASIMGPQL